MNRPRRVSALTVAFVLAACGAQVVAPRPSDTPAPASTVTVTPQATNRSDDVLYVRSADGPNRSSILVINARTGATLRTMSDGAVSADRSTLYWTESVSGGTKTAVHVVDLTSASEQRTFTVDGDLHPATSAGVTGSLSADGRHLALTNSPSKLDGNWITKLAVVDVATGTVQTSAEFRGAMTYGFIGLTPDASAIVLDQYGDNVTRTRIFDAKRNALEDLAGADLKQNGFRTPAVFSPDGRWMFRFDAGSATTNCTSTDGPRCTPNGTPPYVLALDLVSRRVLTLALPIAQLSSDFEKYLLWSIALTSDGSTLYAVNPAIGVVDEIDARRLSLRRTALITVSRSDAGALAALGRLIFPVAEAKRYVVSGALLSPDGRALYAVAHDGISVIDTATLGSRQVWEAKHQFDSLTLSADGARLYAIDNMKNRLVMLDTSDGASLGDLKLASYAPGIVRIDSPR